MVVRSLSYVKVEGHGRRYCYTRMARWQEIEKSKTAPILRKTNQIALIFSLVLGVLVPLSLENP